MPRRQSEPDAISESSHFRCRVNKRPKGVPLQSTQTILRREPHPNVAFIFGIRKPEVAFRMLKRRATHRLIDGITANHAIPGYNARDGKLSGELQKIAVDKFHCVRATGSKSFLRGDHKKGCGRIESGCL